MAFLGPGAIPAPSRPPRRNPYSDEKSLEFGFRVKRFGLIRQLIERVISEEGSVEIVDLGGTEEYWRIGREFLGNHRSRIRITLVNIMPQVLSDGDLFRVIVASGTDPGLLAGRKFDLVHSNSVIEHVGFWRDMQIFASNVRRLAPRYYVQTPNYWFAYEPHFRFPGFQFLPESLRRQMIMTMPLGFFQRIRSKEQARQIIDSHRLLSTRQMRALFPEAQIVHEKLLGMNKSIIAIRD